MIISLEDARKIDENITQNDLDAYEQMVRQITNNNFQNWRVRYLGFTITDEKTINLGTTPVGLRVGDTIQMSDSSYNDGLYTIKEISETFITCVEPNFFNETFPTGFITKIEYPADIRYGVEGLIKWNKEMGAKMGIKSETIARMSVTYYDVNANDNSQGFPAAKLNFLKKYEKMRWG